MVERRASRLDRRAPSRGGRRSADHAGRPLVLLIDDHVDTRDLLSIMLQGAGVSLAEAGTGEEALQRIAARQPSLIFMDMSLPDCHGTEVVRRLKRDPATRDIPVVALSASVRQADKAAAVEAGCIAFLEKPVLPDDVLALVRRLLSGAAA